MGSRVYICAEQFGQIYAIATGCSLIEAIHAKTKNTIRLDNKKFLVMDEEFTFYKFGFVTGDSCSYDNYNLGKIRN